MSIEAEIFSILSNSQDVTNLAESKIQAGMLRQGEPVPAITYYRVASSQAPTLTGPSTYEEAFITISAWADTLQRAIELDGEIVKALEDSAEWDALDNAIAGSNRHLFDEETRKHRVERDWRFFGTSHPTGA